ncbi:MAG: diacylglycerol kinase family protein [Candidatus Obscuribacterales bacterium]|jgi:diacylglycerol kinase family enzyme
MPKQILLVYNPTARSQTHAEEWLGHFVSELTKDGEYLVTLYPTTAETTAQHLVPLLKPPLDLVIAAGGDGTIRFALAALAQAKSDIPAALMPLGTGNVLARNLGIVAEKFFANPLENALDVITNGTPMRIDMGMMNGEYFAGMAGAGPLSDAFVFPARQLKTKFKMLAYATAMVNTMAERPIVFKITTGGRSFCVQASGVFVANVEDLGLGKTADSSLLQDGMLELHVLDPADFNDYVQIGFRFAGGHVDSNKPHYVLKVKEAVIEVVPRRGLRSAFQSIAQRVRRTLTKSSGGHRSDRVTAMIDGEEAGTTPMRITVIPGAVNVLVPKTTAATLEQAEEQLQI